MKKKTAALRKSSGAEAVLVYSLKSSLNSLLHTVRCIAQHEDQLCTLLHELERGGVVGPELREELQEALDALPHEVYLREVAEVRDALEKRPERPAKVAKKKAASKKKPREKRPSRPDR